MTTPTQSEQQPAPVEQRHRDLVIKAHETWLLSQSCDSIEKCAKLAADSDARAVADATAQIKADAAEYKRLFDALFKLGMVKSDPGSLPQWVDEMIEATKELRAQLEDLSKDREEFADALCAIEMLVRDKHNTDSHGLKVSIKSAVEGVTEERDQLRAQLEAQHKINNEFYMETAQLRTRLEVQVQSTNLIAADNEILVTQLFHLRSQRSNAEAALREARKDGERLRELIKTKVITISGQRLVIAGFEGDAKRYQFIRERPEFMLKLAQDWNVDAWIDPITKLDATIDDAMRPEEPAK